MKIRTMLVPFPQLEARLQELTDEGYAILSVAADSYVTFYATANDRSVGRVTRMEAQAYCVVAGKPNEGACVSFRWAMGSAGASKPKEGT